MRREIANWMRLANCGNNVGSRRREQQSYNDLAR